MRIQETRGQRLVRKFAAHNDKCLQCPDRKIWIVQLSAVFALPYLHNIFLKLIRGRMIFKGSGIGVYYHVSEFLAG